MLLVKAAAKRRNDIQLYNTMSDMPAQINKIMEALGIGHADLMQSSEAIRKRPDGLMYKFVVASKGERVEYYARYQLRKENAPLGNVSFEFGAYPTQELAAIAVAVCYKDLKDKGIKYYSDIVKRGFDRKTFVDEVKAKTKNAINNVQATTTPSTALVPAGVPLAYDDANGGSEDGSEEPTPPLAKAAAKAAKPAKPAKAPTKEILKNQVKSLEQQVKALTESKELAVKNAELPALEVITVDVIDGTNLRGWLAQSKLDMYGESLEQRGYDDLDYLLQLPKATLEKVAEEVSMKPGHKRKFVDFAMMPSSAPTA